ncbi:hypothetical protein [Chroococcidiopsis sp. CCALA 051]|nr:hypothetical protein [Chroococcidiopsis sp. CCALA 051]
MSRKDKPVRCGASAVRGFPPSPATGVRFPRPVAPGVQGREERR